MSKTSQTKNKILSLLAEKDMRLADMLPRLDLSSPTVIQHLQELEDMDLIKKVNDPHFRNIKYYTLNKEAKTESSKPNLIMQGRERVRSRLVFIPIILILALIVLYYFFIQGNQSKTQNGNMMGIELLMSSPVNVPYGTNDIMFSYSSVNVHFNSTSGAGWVRVASQGSINLMSSGNSSVFMGHVNVPVAGYVDAATFNITSVSIEVNNTNYPVFVQNKSVATYIRTSSGKINETMGMLVNFYPTITRINSSNPNQFVLTYSVRAVTI